jgi:hypothetical protein
VLTEIFIYICWHSFEDFFIFHVDISVTLSALSLCLSLGNAAFIGSPSNKQTDQKTSGGIGEGGIGGGRSEIERLEREIEEICLSLAHERI